MTRRCGQPVPEALCGDLKVVPACKLDAPGGTHNGDHRATRAVGQLGKITYRWKNKPPRPQPPVIQLFNPVSRKYVPTAVDVLECPCNGLYHVKPCSLEGLLRS